MPLLFTRSTVHFEEECTVEETVALVEFLRTHKSAKIVMRKCTYAHTFLIRALIAFHPKITSLPEDAILYKWLVPIAGANQNMRSSSPHGRSLALKGALAARAESAK